MSIKLRGGCAGGAQLGMLMELALPSSLPVLAVLVADQYATAVCEPLIIKLLSTGTAHLQSLQEGRFLL